MTANQQFIFTMACILVLASIAIVAILVFDSNKKKGISEKKISKYNKRYTFLYDNFLTRNSFRKLVDQVSQLSIYNFMEIRIQSVIFYTTPIYACTAFLVVGALLIKDIVVVVVLLIYVLVMHNVLINKRLDTIRYKMLRELSLTLSNIRDTYTAEGNIPDTIAKANKGKYLAKSLDRISVILTSVDSANKLEEFYATNPFHQLRTLATACYVLADSGDETGLVFKRAVGCIKSEVDGTVRKLTKQRVMFQALEYLPIIPLFLSGPVKTFFIANIPATAIVYNGMVGFISRLLLVIFSLLGYYMITTINSPGYIRSNDRLNLIDTMLRIPAFKKFVLNVQTKKARVKRNLNKVMEGALSSKDITYIYASKVLCSFGVFIFSIFAIIFAITSIKEYTYKNVNSLSLTASTNITDMEKQKLFVFDSKLLELEQLPQDKALSEQLQSILPTSTEMDRMEQISRIKMKYEKYHDTYFRWYYILICYLVAWAAWFTPEMQLKLRKILVKSEAQEDVLQMQTLISILMDTNLDTLDVLYWLSKNSVVHKDALIFAYHEYPSDPEKAISRLKSKSSVIEFHQLCEKLLATVNNQSMTEAFSSLVEDRDNILQIREIIQMEAVNTKRRMASPLALLPLAVLVIGQVLAPIGILGVQQFMGTLGQTGF